MSVNLWCPAIVNPTSSISQVWKSWILSVSGIVRKVFSLCSVSTVSLQAVVLNAVDKMMHKNECSHILLSISWCCYGIDTELRIYINKNLHQINGHSLFHQSLTSNLVNLPPKTLRKKTTCASTLHAMKLVTSMSPPVCRHLEPGSILKAHMSECTLKGAKDRFIRLRINKLYI
jgi:hypothetical protein